MKKAPLPAFLLVALQLLWVPFSSFLPAFEGRAPAKPKLVLAIVADQFRYDYLLRFKSNFNGGLRRLLSNGAVFTNARHEHFPTFTAVGHAALLTGALPGVSGIIGNTWYDRYSGKPVPSAYDESTKLLGGADGPGASPHNLLVSTVGDEMKMATQGKSRVFGISLKDYSGILATGHMADSVYWYDAKTGNFVTSTYYAGQLPEWLLAFNRLHPADRYKDAEWLGTRLPAETGQRLYGLLQFTPFGNELIEEMAEKVLVAEKLGTDDKTDLLVISFSSNDLVGHNYGPDSPQVRDISIATDKTLDKLFEFVDSHVGMKNVLVVFSADHGVSPQPEVNKARKMPGGRIDFGVVGTAIQGALVQRFGEGKWISSTPEDSVYLNWDLIHERKLTQKEVAEVAAQAALKIPHVFRVYTRDQLLNGNVMDDQIGRRMMISYSMRRSADLYILPDPYYLFGKIITTHGTPLGYDNHVPLIFMGPGIKAGRFHESVAINDVAPTLATILEVEIPSGSAGRILSEILIAP